jgi:ELWxxDGT repeat protein
MISLKNGYGTLYFVKGGSLYGSELWKSDGTTTGTVIVKDVNVGPRNSQPWYITECNGKVLFSLHEAKTGAELWATNGSAATTALVKDINTTSTSSSDAAISFKGIVATNSGVVFGAFGPGLGVELYKSDGTTNGTQLLNEINPGENWSSPTMFISKNGSYYFKADNPTGFAIYTTDGNKNGLKKMTVDIPWNFYSLINYDVADNGRLFFTLYNTSSFSYELWTSNGTPSGMITLSNSVSYNPTMITVGNDAFFSAGDFTNGYELWKSDGTIAGTKLVKDINPGFDGSYPYSFISYKGSLYFGAYDNSYIYRLWKSNGTEAGTYVVGDVQFPQTWNNEQLLYYTVISDNILYFAGFSNATFQTLLWKTDGTIAGTKEVNTNLQYPVSLTNVDGTLFFNAYDPSLGLGLYKFNSKVAAPELIKSDLWIQFPTGACGILYFVIGGTLWSSNGTTAGTNPVDDPFLAGVGSFYNLTGSNNKLFFSAYSYKTGRELFVGNVCSQSTNALTASRPAPDDLQIQQVQKVNHGIYPNPTRDILHLNFYRQNTERIRISVTDITGRTVIDQYVTSKEGNNNVAVSVTSLPPGNYFIKLSGTKKQVYHFIKLD